MVKSSHGRGGHGASRTHRTHRGPITRMGYELGGLVTDTGEAWRAGRRPWAAIAMCVLSAACALADEFSAARPTLAHLGDVYASLPIANELARLPLSAFLPTADLPLWAAILQTALVIGIAEMLLGRLATVCVASAGQLLSTMSSRYLIALGTAVLIGLPLGQAGVLDTGPSGMSTAVGGWLLARRGAYMSLALLVLAMAAAAALQPNLDGREHAAALAVGLGAGVVTAPAVRAVPQRAARGLRNAYDVYGGSRLHGPLGLFGQFAQFGPDGIRPEGLTWLLCSLRPLAYQPAWAIQSADGAGAGMGGRSDDGAALPPSAANQGDDVPLATDRNEPPSTP